MLVVVARFLVVMLVGAFLLALPISQHGRNGVVHARGLFWAMKGVCGTGASWSRHRAVVFLVRAIVLLLLKYRFADWGFMTLATFVLYYNRKRITFKDRLA